MNQRRRGGVALALIGIGITVIGVAFTLSPPTHVSLGVFWTIVGVGVLAIASGISLLLFRWKAGGGRRLTQEEIRKRRLLAAECRRVADSLADFIIEWKRAKPRPRPFRDEEIQLRRWGRKGEERYQETFRVWALRVFDAAVQLDGVAPESRVFIDAPSFEHLDQVPELFRDAARSLGSPLGQMPYSPQSPGAPPNQSQLGS